jgi:hypothetical protein
VNPAPKEKTDADLFDPDNSPAIQEEFARRPPNAEDGYFHQQDQMLLNEKKESAGHDSETDRSRTPTETPDAPLERPPGVLQRFIQRLLRTNSTNWRP